jgi:death-on-curing family protein
MRPKRLALAEVEFVAFELARRFMEWGEPIPEFGTRFPDILESCLSQPFVRYNARFLYPGIFRKSAVQFYLMVKNHPFKNGNKRIAITTLLVFLGNHGHDVSVHPDALYEFAKGVAESDPKNYTETIDGIQRFIRDNADGPTADGEDETRE